MHFIPYDDSLLFTPLFGNQPQTPVDFPEFQTIVEMLGGLEASVELDVEVFKAPKEDTL
jgi:hypothetical protein